MVRLIAGFIAGVIFVSTLVLLEFAQEFSAMEPQRTPEEDDWIGI